MSQSLTDPTASDQTSWLPLLGVQRRSHSRVYAMQVNEYATGEEALAASRAASDRLRGAAVKRIAGPRVKPASVPVPVPMETLPEIENTAPLNMLAPCSWRFLVAVAALRHGQSAKDIMGLTRTKPVAQARHEAVYLIALHTTYSIARMAVLFNRDHTTLLNSLRKFPRIHRAHTRVISGPFPNASKSPPTPKSKLDWVAAA